MWTLKPHGAGVCSSTSQTTMEFIGNTEIQRSKSQSFQDGPPQRGTMHRFGLRMDLRKKSKSELIELFQKHGFPKQTGPSADCLGYWRLLSKEVKAFSNETVQKVEALLASKQAAIKKVEGIKLGDLERTVRACWRHRVHSSHPFECQVEHGETHCRRRDSSNGFGQDHQCVPHLLNLLRQSPSPLMTRPTRTRVERAPKWHRRPLMTRARTRVEKNPECHGCRSLLVWAC